MPKFTSILRVWFGAESTTLIVVLLSALGLGLPDLARAEDPAPTAFALPPPTEASGGVVQVTPENTLALLSGNRGLVRVVFPQSDIPVLVPVLGPGQNQTGHQLLRRLYAAGKAAGNGGDLYENRDRAHSRLHRKSQSDGAALPKWNGIRTTCTSGLIGAKDSHIMQEKAFYLGNVEKRVPAK